MEKNAGSRRRFPFVCRRIRDELESSMIRTENLPAMLARLPE
jgi:hypothetical protein